jgi:hypothetical protein
MAPLHWAAMNVARLSALAAIALLTLPLTAFAQWQWMDKDGRKVFSDRPPPIDVPEQRVLKRPGAAAVATAPPAASAAAPTKPTGKDTELEARKQQADAAEAAKHKAEEDRVAQTRADNCLRARQSQSTMNAGLGLVRMDAQGQATVLDDNARAAEQQRVESVIASDCR